VEAGKIKYLGLSECSIETLKRAKKVKGLGEKVIVVQMEYSPFTLDIELPYAFPKQVNERADHIF